MKYLLLTLSALLFTPISSLRITSDLRRNLVNPKTNIIAPVEDLKTIGILPKAGYWDPLNITSNCDDSLLCYLREAEIQHSRVAMASFVGLPLIDVLDVNDVAINALQSHMQNLYPQVFLTSLFFYEVSRICIQYKSPKYKLFRLKNNVYPGNTLQTDITTVDREKRNGELYNGRLAMIGALFYIFELVFNGKVL